METNSIRIKREITTFMLVTFTITFFMGIIMFFIYNYIDKAISSSFALVQMFYPALAAIILIIKYEEENIHKNLINFFKIYIALCILSIIGLLVGTFAFPKYVSKILAALVCIFSIIFFPLIIKNKDNCFEKINMVFQKNFKNVFLLCLTFVGIQFIIIVLSGLVYGNFIETMKKGIGVLGFLPFNVLISIPLSFISFFGEELGWRGYLQPKLQVLFGKKLGVIILGLIWGLWHLPLCFMLYSPKTPIYCVIFHVFYCIFIGIFLGFAYMKTGNLWSTIIIHLINNSLAFSNDNTGGAVFTPQILILNIIICGIVFLPFIFTKEYKGKELEKIYVNSL